MNAYAVFYFAFSEIMEVRLPMSVLLQIFGDAFREENVSGVAAIHHALGHVNARAGDVRPLRLRQSPR